jgi:hypothetical protein
MDISQALERVCHADSPKRRSSCQQNPNALAKVPR